MSIGKIMEETWTLVDSLYLMGSLYPEGFSSDRERLHEAASGHPSRPSGPLCFRKYRKLVYPQCFFLRVILTSPFLATESPRRATAKEAGMITLKIKRIKRIFNRPPNAIQSLPGLAVQGKRQVGDLCIGLEPISIWLIVS